MRTKVLATLKRYDRQIILPELGFEGQQKLQEASVLVIGAGGLGCPLLLYLSGAGIGHIGIVDDDVVDESNLHRQVLYHIADLGKNKAETAVAKLQLFNPHVNLKAYPYRLNAENAIDLMAQYDLIIDGSDNFPTRYLANDTCVALGKPLVFGSIFKFEGQISVFNYRNGPDYRFIYPEPPLAEDAPNCGESGVIGTLCGIIGSLMANEAIKVICGFGEVLSGKLLIFNSLNNETQIFKFDHEVAKDNIDEIAKDSLVYLEEQQNKPATGHLNGEIELKELENWKINGISFQLIDIREEYEYEEYNIGGIHIPLYHLKDNIQELLSIKRIVFCCANGTRSRIAVNLLKPEFKGEIFTVALTSA